MAALTRATMGALLLALSPALLLIWLPYADAAWVSITQLNHQNHHHQHYHNQQYSTLIFISLTCSAMCMLQSLFCVCVVSVANSLQNHICDCELQWNIRYSGNDVWNVAIFHYADNNRICLTSITVNCHVNSLPNMHSMFLISYYIVKTSTLCTHRIHFH